MRKQTLIGIFTLIILIISSGTISALDICANYTDNRAMGNRIENSATLSLQGQNIKLDLNCDVVIISLDIGTKENSPPAMDVCLLNNETDTINNKLQRCIAGSGAASACAGNGLCNFTLASAISLIAGDYMIQTNGSGDDSNYFRWWSDLSAGYGSSEYNAYYTSDGDGGTYVSNSGADNLFIIYGSYNDTTPPVITQINFTSEEPSQLCGNGTICGPTDDTTPTFRITTDESAGCRISDTNGNYSTMSKDCQDLICTLPTNESLILGGTDYVYIACMDNYNNENTTTITVDLSSEGGGALQSNATQAILAGIAASSASSSTTYQDQQVYLRYSNGTQALGTFDVVASLSNQRWLFNYLVNETERIAMSSIGTVVNVWQETSLTYNQVVTNITNYIDSTKN